jgi:hypothetical protein
MTAFSVQMASINSWNNSAQFPRKVFVDLTRDSEDEDEDEVTEVSTKTMATRPSTTQQDCYKHTFSGEICVYFDRNMFSETRWIFSLYFYVFKCCLCLAIILCCAGRAVHPVLAPVSLVQ